VKTGSVVSKFEGDISAAGHGGIALGDLFVALGRRPLLAADRHDKLAHYLSTDDGWHDACAALGGTFSSAAAQASHSAARLTRDEDL
jgi:hypothetical protein